MVTGIALFLCTLVVIQSSAQAKPHNPPNLVYYVKRLLNDKLAVNPQEIATLEDMKTALRRVIQRNNNIRKYVSKKYPGYDKEEEIYDVPTFVQMLNPTVERILTRQVTFDDLRLNVFKEVFSVYTEVFTYFILDTDSVAVAAYIYRRSDEFDILLHLIQKAISDLQDENN